MPSSYICVSISALQIGSSIPFPRFHIYTLILEKAMAPHSSTLAWKIPWMEEPGRLQSMGSLAVRQNSATSLSLFTFVHWRRKWQPTLVCLENPRGRGAWWAAVYGVEESWTWLKRLSSSSMLILFFFSWLSSFHMTQWGIYHCTLVRMAIIKRSTNSKCYRGWGIKGNPFTPLVGKWIGAATM